ncbi:MAG: VTT domain-containing protein [Bacteroidota bacterium]
MASVASIFEPGRNCCTVARAERVALLVDADAYFRAFMQAAERAKQSILILAWDFSSATRLHFDDTPRHGPPARLGDFLNWLARRRPDLQIRVLDWDYPMVFGTDREFPTIWGLGWKAHRRVEIAYDNTHPVGGSHHQKIVVIDDTLAFTGGFDLAERRWDTPAHAAEDRRRQVDGVGYPPFHDLMMAVDGAAARALGDIARARWRDATGETLEPPNAAPDLWPPALPVDMRAVDVALACTRPALAEAPAVRQVEALYLDMIAAARQRIYIENQYFTAESIGSALAARLAEADGPEIVVVLRLLSHGWLEEHTMHVLRTRLIQRLREADRHGRFFLYYAHIDGLKEGTCIDIHSKLMIVDDAILRIGSANLSNRSMGMDSECDAVIEARGDPVVATAIGNFRNRLLGEHLAAEPERVAAEIQRHGNLHDAIAALSGQARTLKTFAGLPEWPEAVLELVKIADPDGPVIDEMIVEVVAPRPPPGRASDWRVIGLRLAALVLFLLGLTALWRYTPLANYLHPDIVIAAAEKFATRPWAPVVIILAYTPACLIMFPRPLITLAAVVAFGPMLGTAYALAGVMLAAMATYVAGRRLPHHVVRHLTGHSLNRMSDTLRRHGLLAVTALRLVPLAPFAAEGLVAGAIHIKAWHFMLGSLLGLMPGVLTTMAFGQQIGTALQDPSKIRYELIGGLVLLMVVLTLLVRRWLVSSSRQSTG